MRESKTLKSIKLLYNMSNLNYNEIFKKTDILLKNYKNLCWKSAERANEFYEQLQLVSKRLDVALEFLVEYNCEMEKNRFLSRISSLFKTKWLVEVIDIAMGHMYDFPDNGKLLKEVIKITYIDYFGYTENERLELLNIDRSVYYARKKEAIALLGYAIWGMVIPQYLPKVLFKIISCQGEQDTPDSLLEIA